MAEPEVPRSAPVDDRLVMPETRAEIFIAMDAAREGQLSALASGSPAVCVGALKRDRRWPE